MDKTISIVQINDTHAQLLEHGDARYGPAGFYVETLGGYPRILSKIKEYQALYPGELLVLDNGDTFHGTHEAVQTRGQVMVPYLQALGVHAMTFHWDAAYTPARLRELEQALGYPVLACNVYHRGTRRLMFKPQHTFEVQGLKVAVIGLASNIIQKNMPAVFSQGADFTDGIREAAAQVRKARKAGADLVILLSHLGYPQDIALLTQVPGIDLCLSGHTHNRVRTPQKIGGAYIIQSGAMASSLGFVRLTLGEGGIRHIAHEYVVLDKAVLQDRGLLKKLRHDPLLLQFRDYLDTPVGSSRVDLHRASSFYGTMDCLLLDAMRLATGLPIAFSNGWRYGGAVKKGRLTRRHLYAIVPMDPEIRTARLTGAQITRMLEDNLESTFSTRPFDQMGGYIKRVAGLKVYFKLENPYGQRVQRVFTPAGEIGPDTLYEVAYVTRQGVPERYGSHHQGTGRHAVAAMEALLKRGPYQPGDVEAFVPV